MVQSQELRSEKLSGSTQGEPIIVANDYGAGVPDAADVTTVHAMTALSVLDVVFLRAWNITGSSITLFLVLNPTDDTSTSSIDDATVQISVPGRRAIWVLEGERFRQDSGTWTISAYVANADLNNIKLTGWVNRLTQGTVTP